MAAFRANPPGAFGLPTPAAPAGVVAGGIASSVDWGHFWAILVVATVLFVLLLPGFILSLPPVPASLAHPTIAKRVFFTKVVTWQSVLLHTIIFIVVFGIFLYLLLRSTQYKAAFFGLGY